MPTRSTKWEQDHGTSVGSDAFKMLNGDRSSRINRNEPRPAGASVEPTDDLDIAARSVWDRVAPDLIRQGVLTAWDAEAFTVYCQTVAVYRDAHRSLQDAGLTDRGAAGGVIKSPYWQIMRDAVVVMTTIGSRFGLTPTDRTHLKTESAAGRDPNWDLLSSSDERRGPDVTDYPK